MHTKRVCSFIKTVAVASAVVCIWNSHATGGQTLQLNKGDHICIIGNGNIVVVP